MTRTALALIAALLLALAAPARAQDDGQAYVPRDDQIDAALRQASELEAKGRLAEAVRALQRAESRVDELRRLDPTSRLVVPREGEKDVFDGAERAIRRRLGALPEEALKAWRADRDPKAEALLERAQADLSTTEHLEALVSRYPLAAAAPRAWELLADLRLERGAFADALAALETRWESAGEAEIPAPAKARMAWARARLAGAGESAGAASWPMDGGDATRARRAAPGPIPGAPVLTVALPIPEASRLVAQGFERRGKPIPFVSTAVGDGLSSGAGIYVADAKSVVAFDERTRGVRWIYIAVGDGVEMPDPPLLPERLENLLLAPAIDGGRVFATLNRNTPPIWPPSPPKAKKKKRIADEEEGDAPPAEEGAEPAKDGEEGKPKEPEKKPKNQPPVPDVVAERRRDVRIVALDAASGRLLWDAARPETSGAASEVPQGAPGAVPQGAQPGPAVPGAEPGKVATVGVPEAAPPGGAKKPQGAAAAGALSPSFDDLLRTARHVTTPLAAQGRVYFGATTFAQGSLQAYAFALDAATGRPIWRVFLAAGSPDDFRSLACEVAPLALEGGRLIVQTNLGTVAALDPIDGSFHWIARYRSTPAASQKRIIRDDLRFAPSPARVVAGKAVVAPQDAGWLYALDLRTGRLAWRFPRDGVRYVAGVSRGRLILAGEGALRALDGATGRVAWEAADPPRGVRGAPFAAEDRIYVSTEEALLVYGAAGGAREASLRHGPRGSFAGNVSLMGERIAIVSATEIALLEPAPRTLARFEAAAGRAPRDADPALAHGIVLARLDQGAAGRAERRERAFSELARAQDLLGPDRPVPSGEARGEAFLLARDAALDALGAKDERAALLWTERALAVVNNDPAGLAFVRAAAAAWIALGRPRDAVAAWRRGLERHRDLDIPLAAGITAPAGPYIRDQLVRIRKEHGAAALVDHDRAAAKLLEAARAVSTPEAYEQVLALGAGSDSEAAALLALGAVYEKRDLANLAARYYERHAERFPDAKEAPETLFRLARLLERTKRKDEELRVVREVERRFPTAVVQVDKKGEPRALGRWAAERLVALASTGETPMLPVGAIEEPGMGRSFQTWTELDGDDARIVTPPGLEGHAEGIFFVSRPGAVEARLLESGALLWRREGKEMRGDRTGVVSGTAVLSAGRSIEGVDLRRGLTRWRWGVPGLVSARPGDTPSPDVHGPSSAAEEPDALSPFAPKGEPFAPEAPTAPALPAADGGRPSDETPEEQLERAKSALASLEALVDPDPLKGLVVTGERVVVIFGRDVLALDAATGEVAWRVRREESLYKDPIPVPAPRGGSLGTRVIVASEAPAKLIALDLATGAEAWTLPLGDRDPRITVAPVAARGGRRIFCVVASSDLVAVDGAAGIQIWRRRLPFWTRDLVAARDGSAVAIVAHPSPEQPKIAVFDGASGAPGFEERAEKGRVGPVAFDGDRVFYFAGDMITGRVRAIDWKSGVVKWMWSPQRGQSFSEIVVARDHLVLAQTAPLGGGVVFVLDKERGAIFRTFALEGKRVETAVVSRGSIIVATTRGIAGYARIDPPRLKEELSDLAQAALAAPEDALLRAKIADRRFKLGDLEGAISACEEGLYEATSLGAYELLDRQMLGYVEARPPADRIEIARLPRAPEIDGDLRDVWPLHQSIALDRPRNVRPVQGHQRIGVLRGKEDLSATLYLGYDDRYFYFALDVDDSSLVPYDSEKEEWKGDCLLIAIDALGNGGDGFQRDDNLLSLALTLPKKNKKPEEEEEDEENEPDGRYFVKRKDDGTGAVYEGAIPWQAFIEHSADIDPVRGPKEGFTFGFDVIVADDDDNDGAKKALSWTPGVTLHREKRKLWNGFVPGRFGKVICR